MFTRCACVAVLAWLAALGSAPGADDEAIKKEMKKLEGTWQLVSLEEGGKEVLSAATAKDNRILLTVKGDGFKITLDGQTFVEGTYKVVEVKGKVRKSDVTYTSPPDFVTKTPVPQLAEWTDDDTFRAVMPDPQAEKPARPTEFVTKQGEKRVLAVYKRVKK